jgi:PII-like signaling protein
MAQHFTGMVPGWLPCVMARRRRREAIAMRLAGRALRLTVFLDEDVTWHHKPLYHEIVHRAHQAGLAGATVLRGVEGFGAGSTIHTSRLLSLAENLPAVVIVVDDEERIRAFLPQLDELVEEGMVILDEVEVIRYVGRQHGG